MAKKGTDSVWVLLLTGPLWPWWTGLSHATRGTPFRERTFPPRDSIRVFSDGTSGLWSAVRATAWSFFSLLSRPSAARESPTWAMYSVLPLRITTVAVVPDVLGSPCLVRGQESANELVRFKNILRTTLKFRSPLPSIGEPLPRIAIKFRLRQYWVIILFTCLHMRASHERRPGANVLPSWIEVEEPHGVNQGDTKINPGRRRLGSRYLLILIFSAGLGMPRSFTFVTQWEIKRLCYGIMLSL